MKRFKIRTGKCEPHDITRENFERYTRKEKGKYVQIGKDLEQRCFAVCPACDNPIQLIGLYKGDKTYGKHYCRSVANIAEHNEQAYRLCPYASNNYSPPNKEDRKAEMTEFELEIYNIVREHFDQIIYLLKKETGLYIDASFARSILRNYYAARGWMYNWATLYNIPWMLLYLYSGFDVFGMLVSKESSLHKFLQGNRRYKLEEQSDFYDKIKTTQWTKSNLMLSNHKRSVESDAVCEAVTLDLAIEENGSWTSVWEKTLEINENRFPRLINSESRETFRDEALLSIAREELPEILI